MSSWIHSGLEYAARYVVPPKTKSTVRVNGELTLEEFEKAGNYLINKYPTWSWDAKTTYLYMKSVPCQRGRAENKDVAQETVEESSVDEGEGWINTGGRSRGNEPKPGSLDAVRTLDGNGNAGEEVLEGEDEIPDMDDDDDPDAIIRNPTASQGNTGTDQGNIIQPSRTYDLYIAYSDRYHTPQMFLSGYSASGQPLTFNEMKEDFMVDYTKGKEIISVETFRGAPGDVPVKMVTPHACAHGQAMTVLLDKADAADRVKEEKARMRKEHADAERLVSGTEDLKISPAEAWEVVDSQEKTVDHQEKVVDDEDPRAEQYLTWFLKYIASIMPSVEWDTTMAI